jgi:ABC-type Fe3+-hydroxamate transport system substrate-binding protein
MRKLLGEIERNNQDIAYAYLQTYQLTANQQEQARMLARIQGKREANAQLLREMQEQIDQALTTISA